VLHDNDLAEVILDRVLERGQLVALGGRSFRTRHLDPETLTNATSTATDAVRNPDSQHDVA
jgi:hypothetical protein